MTFEGGDHENDDVCRRRAAAAIGMHTAAEAAPKPPATVTIEGCTRQLMPFCSVIVYRGTTYVLHNSTIPPRTKVRVKGRVTGTAGVCPGSQMTVVSSKTLSGKCP